MGKIYDFNFREQKVENEAMEKAEVRLRGAIAAQWIIKSVKNGDIALSYEISQEFRKKEKDLTKMVMSLNERYRNEDKVQRACWNREIASQELIMDNAIKNLAALISESAGNCPPVPDKQAAVQEFLLKIRKTT